VLEREEDCPEIPRCALGEFCWHRMHTHIRRLAEDSDMIGLLVVRAICADLLIREVPGVDRGIVYEVGLAADGELWKRAR
jgi:hypothetical protein